MFCALPHLIICEIYMFFFEIIDCCFMRIILVQYRLVVHMFTNTQTPFREKIKFFRKNHLFLLYKHEKCEIISYYA